MCMLSVHTETKQTATEQTLAALQNLCSTAASVGKAFYRSAAIAMITQRYTVVYLVT